MASETAADLFRRAKAPGVTFGLPALDQQLDASNDGRKPGLRAGEIAVLTGPPASGKTLALCATAAAHVLRGGAVAWIACTGPAPTHTLRRCVASTIAANTTCASSDAVPAPRSKPKVTRFVPAGQAAPAPEPAQEAASPLDAAVDQVLERCCTATARTRPCLEAAVGAVTASLFEGMQRKRPRDSDTASCPYQAAVDATRLPAPPAPLVIMDGWGAARRDCPALAPLLLRIRQLCPGAVVLLATPAASYTAGTFAALGSGAAVPSGWCPVVREVAGLRQAMPSDRETHDRTRPAPLAVPLVVLCRPRLGVAHREPPLRELTGPAVERLLELIPVRQAAAVRHGHPHHAVGPLCFDPTQN